LRVVAFVLRDVKKKYATKKGEKHNKKRKKIFWKRRKQKSIIID